MTDISGIISNIFNFFSIDLFGSTVIFSMFLIAILMIFLFQMGASRFVMLAFVVPLMIILSREAGWMDSWIGIAGMLLVAFLLLIILRRVFQE